jgi:signal transduction histidine kinase
MEVKMPNFYFRTNAKVESLVGRDLITNNIIAIFELVKNSFDAGASFVDIQLINFLVSERNDILNTKNSYIVIQDNGKGMTSREIEEYWMELGTPYKEKNSTSEVRFRETEIDKVVKRTVNGEKGIGRFGVDKIGSYLKMVSVDKELKEKTTVTFDWDSFNDRDKLIEEIPCEYQIENVDENDKSGLKLEIHNLRDSWTGTDLKNLKRSLKKFLSPINIEQDSFKIFITTKSENELLENTEEITNDSFNYLNTYIKARIAVDGFFKYEIFDNGKVVETNEKYFYDSNNSPFGEVSAEIFYLNTNDKRIFTNKMGLRPSDYGNIKIFRDNFRVMPYGEPSNDWLEIDKIHAQGIFRSFGTRDLIGHLILSHDPLKQNKVLKEATDRVGLIEDVYEFDALKDFTWEIIKILQNYIFNRLKKEANDATKVLKTETGELKKDALDTINSIRTIINKTNLTHKEKEDVLSNLEGSTKNFFKSIDTVESASREIEKKIKVFSQMANKEGILYEMLHNIKNKLTVIDAQIRDFELDLEEYKTPIKTNVLKTAFKDIYKLVYGSLEKINSSKVKKEIIIFNDLLNEVMKNQNSLLRQQNIELTLNITNSNEVKIKCARESIINVFENLFNNSVKALSDISNKNIVIETRKNQGHLEIYFSDNGIGIPEDKIQFIFSLWSSNTNGTGIGLTTSRDIIEEHGGEISYVDIFEEDISTTFLIVLPIK